MSAGFFRPLQSCLGLSYLLILPAFFGSPRLIAVHPGAEAKGLLRVGRIVRTGHFVLAGVDVISAIAVDPAAGRRAEGDGIVRSFCDGARPERGAAGLIVRVGV